MEGVHAPFDRAAAASLIGWWREAGHDILVEDAPRNWLTRPASTPALIANKVAERVDPVAAPTQASPDAPLPATLPELLAWLRDSADVPEARWGRTRILPAGNPSPDLMILTDIPEPGDAEAGRLLAGEVGDLFDRMLAAIGQSRESIWLAPIATVRAVGRIPAQTLPRLAAIARHQIALVAPKRLLIMGKTPNELLIGPDWQARRGDLQTLNLGHATVEAVATFHPRLLYERPKYKAEAWKDLQLLIKGL